MQIGLIDVDQSGFPNLALMKISGWHKKQGDEVEWYYPALLKTYDRVYMSKVFTFTSDYEYPVYADEVIRGGTGGLAGTDDCLPEYIEHAYPDYSLYPQMTENTASAYGFLTRGCPRQCKFCIVGKKEGTRSCKVADLSEFWNGQKNIKLLDPNILACQDSTELLQQLIDCGATIDFSQGLDVRLLTEENIKLLLNIRLKNVHFAWDNYRDWNVIVPKLELFKQVSGMDRRKIIVYMLTNYDTTHEQDLERVYKLKEIGCNPDVRIFNKGEYVYKNGRLRPDVLERFTSEQVKHFRLCQKLQRWVNARPIWEKSITFDQYLRRSA